MLTLCILINKGIARFFFYKMCYHLILKVQKRLNVEIIKRVNFKDARASDMRYIPHSAIFEMYKHLLNPYFAYINRPLSFNFKWT